MSDEQLSYPTRLSHEFGRAWNDFWFATADARPLAWIRIATGIAATFFFVSWLGQIETWFGPDGNLPKQMVRELLEADNRLLYRFSPLYSIDNAAGLYVFLAIAIVASVTLTIGLSSRWSAIVTFLALLSIVHRAPMLTGPFETYLAMLLAYLSIGASGDVLSLDAWLAQRQSKPLDRVNWLANLSLRLIQVHLTMLISFTVLSALASRVWWDGTSIWFLASQTIARPLNLDFLGASPKFVNFWTHLFVLVNVLFPVLVWNQLLRPLMLILCAFVWISMAIVTGQFLYITLVVVSLLAFVESEPTTEIKRAKQST